MKKVIFGSLFALVATIGLVSCDKKEVSNEKHYITNNREVSVDKVETLEDKSLIETLRTKLNNLKSIDSTIIDSVKLITFSEKEMKGLVVPISENESYTTFIKDGELTDFEMLIKIEEGSQLKSNKSVSSINNNRTITYSNIKGEVLTEIDITYKDGKPQLTAPKPKTSFSKCMDEQLAFLTENWVLGIGCMIYGPECAVALMYHCANR